jgi:hypothetical protein
MSYNGDIVVFNTVETSNPKLEFLKMTDFLRHVTTKNSKFWFLTFFQES